MKATSPIFAECGRRVVVIDGAMGTEIQKAALAAVDFGATDGLNEMLVLTRPDVIAGIHRSFLEAGADIIETNSFGSNRIVLQEYGIPGRAAELSRAAAELARSVADRFSVAGRARWVSGSVGPGSRLPSLGQVDAREMLDAYREQGEALLLGGVDMFQVETCQDPLQAKLAVLGLSDAMAAVGREVPVFCQVTVDAGGRMLLGTDVTAAVATLSAIPGVDAVGLNCSTGPDAMHSVLRRLTAVNPLPTVALPNAGLPENDSGRLVYRLSPEDFATQVRSFVEELGVAFVGGCCGTSPAHIRALARSVEGLRPGRPACGNDSTGMLSSLFSAVSMHQEPGPLIIGESTNANGSKAFRSRLLENDFEGMLQVGREQVEEGAHVIDVCLAAAGRDEVADVRSFVPLAGRFLDVPMMIDSTDPLAIEEALLLFPGRAVVNSVNFEDGGSRLDRIAAAARRHGAAIVALTIDEDGMAMTAARKAAVAGRLIDRLVGVHGFAPFDIFIDPLTFTMASGDATLRSSAVETIDAIRLIKSAHPGVRISLGVSNCSYGLKPEARRVLNSVMLHQCMAAGLDAAILRAGKMLPLASIPAHLRDTATALVTNVAPEGVDPLEAFLERFGDGSAILQSDGDLPEMTVDERCRRAVIRGDRTALAERLAAALEGRDAMSLVNDVLLDAMREVGVLFGRGDMQLPFVLRSAEVMKAAVEILRPELSKGASEPRGTLVIATVVGDVHDIGKNLVDIIVSNNGYRVVNLGVKQTVDAMIAAAAAEHADAIGMSGLLVKSTQAMKDNLVVMARAGLSIPVLVGGAALDRSFVEKELVPAYPGAVHYCRDAFDGLKALDGIVSGRET